MSTIVNVETIRQPQGFTLNTVDLSVYFRGNIPLRDVPDHIPIEISVRLVDEWTEFSSALRVGPNDNLIQSEKLNPAMFPFLPLPSDFDPTNVLHWQRLVNTIQTCLVANTSLENKYPQAYLVMRDLFWMAFVASFPTFPDGDWPLWDTRIQMDGGFITSWARNLEEDVPVVQQAVWGQFKTTVEHMLLIPVVL